MIARLKTSRITLLRAVGMALVAVVLIGASVAFGVFGSFYDMNGPYHQLYPASSPTAPAR
jgi:hypothetical protein